MKHPPQGAWDSDLDQGSGQQDRCNIRHFLGAFRVARAMPAGDHAHQAADGEGDGLNLYIECVDGVYSMTYRYYIIDMYNWHRTSRLGEILNDMHIAGISKEYLMSGYFEGSLVWQSGDDLSVDSIRKKVYSDMVNHLINDGVVNAGFQEFYTKYNIHNDAYPHYDAFRIKERFI